MKGYNNELGSAIVKAYHFQKYAPGGQAPPYLLYNLNARQPLYTSMYIVSHPFKILHHDERQFDEQKNRAPTTLANKVIQYQCQNVRSHSSTMPIGVEMTFRVPNHELHHVKIDATSIEVPNVPWKEGQEPPKVRVYHTTYTPWRPPAGSFVYSGRHDHGVLLPPRGGKDSDMAHLIVAVQQAKERSNEYLTRIIEQEKVTSPISEPSTKRTKVEEDDGNA
eukprot:scaffold34612_cov165-Amphora_coffeaeformis.AAC.27